MAPGLFYYSLLQYKNLREEIEQRDDDSLHDRPDDTATKDNQRKYEDQTVLFDKLHASAHKIRCKRIQNSGTIQGRNWDHIEYEKAKIHEHAIRQNHFDKR